MKHISFSPTEAIRFGWNTFMKRKKFWVIASLLFFTLGGGGDINLGNSWKSDAENGKQKESSRISPREDRRPMMNYQREGVNDAQKRLPLVPERVDSVLGISDQRDKGNFGIFIVLFILVLLVFSLPYIVAAALVNGALQMGFMKFFLTAVRGGNPQYEMILSEVKIHKSFRFLAASCLYVLLVGVGLLFFVIPGVYFALKYAFVSYFVADKDAKIGESFTLSAAATNGNKWNLLGLAALMVLVNIAGFFALIYGLLVSVPVSMLAYLYAYNKLSGKNHLT